MESGAVPTQEFQSVKSTLQALEEIESGNVVVHPDPEAKREALRRRIEAERIRKEEEERKIKEQIAKEFVRISLDVTTMCIERIGIGYEESSLT